MARRSKVEQLPQPITDAVNGLIREGRTIDDISAHLRSMGVEDISRSAVGRHVKSAREAFEKYRQAQEVAKVWVNKLEAEPNGDVSRLLPEMLRVVAFQTIGQISDSEKMAKPMDVMLLAKAIRDLAGTSKTQIEVEQQLRAMRANVKQAASEVEATARQAGMSESLVIQIKQRILGVGDGA